MVLEAIKYQRGSLQIIDQLDLPHRETYLPIRTVEQAWQAIREMRVRGAPAIAIVAALAVAVEVHKQASVKTEEGSAKDSQQYIVKQLTYLVTSRPTAVNLGDAARKLEAIMAQAAAVEAATADSVRMAYITAAEKMLVDDVHDNERIGQHGRDWLLQHAADQEAISVLTHCNTGSLATAGYGTALGIVRALHAVQRLQRAFYTETRPYNQGARLTGYELLHDGIPATLIADSMAAAVMHGAGPAGRVAAVIVGADRVAANGDTANKIGTYGLAVLARHHGVKFVVAAPRTTVDLRTSSGAEIVVEQRAGREMLALKGPQVTGYARHPNGHEGQQVNTRHVYEVSTAALGTHAWNPAFDVTPAALIDAIVTELGVAEKDANGHFHLESLFEAPEEQTYAYGNGDP